MAGSETKDFITQRNSSRWNIRIFLWQFPEHQFPQGDAKGPGGTCTGSGLPDRRETLSLGNPDPLQWTVRMPSLCSGGKHCIF